MSRHYNVNYGILVSSLKDEIRQNRRPSCPQINGESGTIHRCAIYLMYNSTQTDRLHNFICLERLRHCLHGPGFICLHGADRNLY